MYVILQNDVPIFVTDTNDVESVSKAMVEHFDDGYVTVASICHDGELSFYDYMECEFRIKEIPSYTNAQSQTQQLQEWKESMTTIQNELDLQGIGNALGLKLGTSIAPQVLPKIKELVDLLNRSKLMIGKLKRSMLVHPDCELGSEFCDYTTDAQNLEDEIEELIK